LERRGKVVAEGTTVGITLLFTDLVGSTQVASSLSPEVADELRKTHFGVLRSAITSTGGSEVKNLGDGLMVAFSSPSRALACAVAMQQGIERHNARSSVALSVRIGVSGGEATEENGDYFGDPVIEAARLCAAANGGQILASDVVRAMVGRHAPVELVSIGELELKGLPDPVPVVEVRWSSFDGDGAVPMPGRLVTAATEGLFSFFGRANELEQLETSVKHASNGLKVALVAGEPGIGKTSLAAQAARSAHAAGATVLFGSCDEVVSAPYRPWIMALTHLLRHAPDEPLTSIEPVHAAALGQLLPSIGTIPAVSEPGGTDFEAGRFLLFEAVASLFEAASHEHPLVVVLDDVQWADAASLDLLRHLVGASGRIRGVIIATYRDSDLPRGAPLASLLAELWREPDLTRIALRGLADVELLELMEAAAGHEMPSEGVALAHALQRETNGNPFFTVELLRHLAETGAFQLGEDGRYNVVGDLESLALPTSVREVVAHRVARLGNDLVTVLATAAVIGQEFELDVLAAASDRNEDELLDLLERAATASLVIESHDVPGRYRFVHALIAHTLAQDLSPTRLQRAHLRIAEALEALGEDQSGRLAELARHWLAATRPAEPERALHYLRRAGEQAIAALAPTDAIDWLTQGLELLDRQPAPDRLERGFFLAALAQAQVDAGLPEFEATLRQANALALELADRDLLVAVAGCFQGGWNEVSIADPDRVAVFEAALEAIDPGDSTTRARLLVGLAEEIDRRDWQRRHELARQAIAIARRVGDSHALAEVLTRSLGMRWGPDDDALRTDARLAVDLARASGLTLLLVYSLPQLLVCAIDDADFDEATAVFGEMELLADQTGLTYHRWRVDMSRSFLQLLAGDAAAAEASSNAAFELGTAMNYLPAFSTFGAQLMEIRRQQGRLEEVIALAERGVEEYETLPGWNAAVAVLYAELGQLDKVREIFDAAATTEFGGVPRDVTWLLALACWADCASDLGSVEFAPLLIERLAPFSGRVIFTTAHTLGAVGRSLGRLQTLIGDHTAAEVSLREALEIHQKLKAPYWIARTQLDLADLLATRQRPGDTAQAARLIADARRTATTYRLDGLRNHARFELND
jgi:class 3 adenylate cyclase/tetratricopeptide (TPR) repeat protein